MASKSSIISTSRQKTKTGRMVTRLHQRRLAACLSDIDHLKSRLQLGATAGITTASRWFGSLMAHAASGDSTGNALPIVPLAFSISIMHNIWASCQPLSDGNPAHTQQQWFARMRHQLRHVLVSALSKNGLVKQV